MDVYPFQHLYIFCSLLSPATYVSVIHGSASQQHSGTQRDPSVPERCHCCIESLATDTYIREESCLREHNDAASAFTFTIEALVDKNTHERVVVIGCTNLYPVQSTR